MVDALQVEQLCPEGAKQAADYVLAHQEDCLDPANYQYILNLVIKLASHSQHRRIIRLTRFLLQKAYYQKEVFIYLVQALCLLGNYDKVHKVLVRAEKVLPSGEINLLFASYYYQIRDYQRCLAKLGQASTAEQLSYIGLETKAMALEGMQRYEEAVQVRRTMQRLQPHAQGNQWFMAIDLLSMQQFAQGWPLYQARKLIHPDYFQIKSKAPLWQGELLDGRSILVVGEQGAGDQLQFIYLLQLLREQYDCRIVLHTTPGLHRLMATLPMVDQVISGEHNSDTTDYYCHQIDLASYVDPNPARMTYHEIPFQLGQQAMLSDALRAKLSSPGLKIGLNWAGNPAFAYEKYRRVELDLLARLVQHYPQIQFYSLQKMDASPGVEQLCELGVIDLAPELDDYYTSALVMQHLSGFVGSCSSPIHLAGVLGVPAILLLSYEGDWRWGTRERLTPWYPNLSVVQQQVAGDWLGLQDRLLKQFSARCSQKRVR